MHRKILLLIGLLCTTAMIHADERFRVIKVGGDVYSNVLVTSVSATDIYFTHSAGIGSVKIKDLDPILQQHFHFDREKAKTAQQASQAGNAAYLTGTSTAPVAADLSNPKATMDKAMEQVRAIVNQPVTHVAIAPGMSVSVSSPGWFHPGAIRPDFNTVDVRTTQQLQYINDPYITSDINPGVCFLGPELEFNSMTKFFYTDRSLPKKRLTEAEMVEINRLYRIIGQCEQKLAGTQGAGSNSAGTATAVQSAVTFLSVHKATVVSIAAGLLLVLMIILNARKGRVGA